MLLQFILALLPNLEYRIYEAEYKRELASLNLIQLVFYKMEMFDIRERNNILYYDGPNFTLRDLIGDSLLMYGRYVTLKDAPPFWVHLIFCYSPDDITSMRNENFGYQRYLEGLIDYQTNPLVLNQIKQCLAETKWLNNLWDYLLDAKKDMYYMHLRRIGLLRLKEKLDKLDPSGKMFWEGRMPYHVPIWNYTQTKP